MRLLRWFFGLFGSTRSEKEMKSLASRDGNFCSEKSNEDKNNSIKGELNINVSYRTNVISKEIKETFKGAAILTHLDNFGLMVEFDNKIDTSRFFHLSV